MPWFDASASLIAELLDQGNRLVINAVVYAEISASYARMEECAHLLSRHCLEYEEISQETAFLAGKAFLLYRGNKGNKISPLPDFFIGAHAAVKGYTLLTRDAKRYHTYFPKLAIISP